MSRPAIIFITVGVKFALLALSFAFTLLDAGRSLKQHFSRNLPNRSKKADAEQAGIMRMSDGSQ